MGMNTQYLGALTIVPPLNPEETTWLRAFAQTHRELHPDDPYAVPMNPRAEYATLTDDSPPHWPAASARAAAVPPLARCDWQPTISGTHLRWVEMEKSNTAEIEIAYLIDHFLRPGALAASDDRPDFADFTFDHVVNGIIAGERDDGRLFLLNVTDNEVREVVLVREEPLPFC